MSTNSIPIDLVRSVVATLPISARTSQNTNSPSFHIVKLPPPNGSVDRLQQVIAEYCIQPLGSATRQAIWWTSYVVLARPGGLSRGSGVFPEWNEFGTFSSGQMGIMASVTPRTSDINIVDISKGVLNGNQTNGTVLRVVDLSGTPSNVEIFTVLVASGMHDGAYQVGGQARLEFKIQNW